MGALYIYIYNISRLSVNAVPRSGSKNDNKECPIGERASGDNDNCIRYDPEQVTRGRLNACCSSHATIDDRKGDSRGEEVINNFDVCTAKLGRYEERICWRHGAGT